MNSVNRGVDASINIRRVAVLKTSPEELTRANAVRQPLILQVFREKRKPIAFDRSINATRRLQVDIPCIPMIGECFSFYRYCPRRLQRRCRSAGFPAK